MTEPDYLAMAEFLKPRGYRISGDIAIFPGGLSVVCANEDEAYQMALGHFLAGELGRHWRHVWNIITDSHAGLFAPFTQEWHDRTLEAIRFYEALEAQE